MINKKKTYFNLYKYFGFTLIEILIVILIIGIITYSLASIYIKNTSRAAKKSKLINITTELNTSLILLGMNKGGVNASNIKSNYDASEVINELKKSYNNKEKTSIIPGDKGINKALKPIFATNHYNGFVVYWDKYEFKFKHSLANDAPSNSSSLIKDFRFDQKLAKQVYEERQEDKSSFKFNNKSGWVWGDNNSKPNDNLDDKIKEQIDILTNNQNKNLQEDKDTKSILPPTFTIINNKNYGREGYKDYDMKLTIENPYKGLLGYSMMYKIGQKGKLISIPVGRNETIIVSNEKNVYAKVIYKNPSTGSKKESGFSNTPLIYKPFILGTPKIVIAGNTLRGMYYLEIIDSPRLSISIKSTTLDKKNRTTEQLQYKLCSGIKLKDDQECKEWQNYSKQITVSVKKFIHGVDIRARAISKYKRATIESNENYKLIPRQLDRVYFYSRKHTGIFTGGKYVAAGKQDNKVLYDIPSTIYYSIGFPTLSTRSDNDEILNSNDFVGFTIHAIVKPIYPQSPRTPRYLESEQTMDILGPFITDEEDSVSFLFSVANKKAPWYE